MGTFFSLTLHNKHQSPQYCLRVKGKGTLTRLFPSSLPYASPVARIAHTSRTPRPDLFVHDCEHLAESDQFCRNRRHERRAPKGSDHADVEPNCTREISAHENSQDSSSETTRTSLVCEPQSGQLSKSDEFVMFIWNFPFPGPVDKL